MSGWWGGRPEPGDWVRTTRGVPLTITDRLLGGDNGLPAGSLGVVLDRRGSRLRVDVDAGWSRVTTEMPSGCCRVVRRGGGADAFHRRTSRLAVVRVALAVALLLPVLQFVVLYLWQKRTTDGLLTALVVGVLEGAGESLSAALTQPGRAAVYAVAVAVLWRTAFGRR